MNKGELIKAMADKAGFSNKDAATAYEAFIDVVTEALKNGDKVQLAGFGSFEVKDVPARKGRNPQTGEEVDIEAYKKPVVKFGSAYKANFN